MKYIKENVIQKALKKTQQGEHIKRGKIVKEGKYLGIRDFARWRRQKKQNKTDEVVFYGSEQKLTLNLNSDYLSFWEGILLVHYLLYGHQHYNIKPFSKCC